MRALGWSGDRDGRQELLGGAVDEGQLGVVVVLVVDDMSCQEGAIVRGSSGDGIEGLRRWW